MNELNHCDLDGAREDIRNDENRNDDFRRDDLRHEDSRRGGRLCQRFAEILGGNILESRDGLCAVARRRNIRVEIAGRPTQSPLVLDALFSFESMDRQGRTLNLGETVILQDEINPFISVLRELGISVTALHNHWLFDQPRLMYIHFFSIEDPITFARKVAQAFRVFDRI
jgi:hypothetical protein